MSLVPVEIDRRAFAETRVFVGFVRRVVLLSEAVSKAAASIEQQAAEIATLKEDVRILRAENALQAARLEGIAVAAAANVTGELSRRIGYLEGRASRD